MITQEQFEQSRETMRSCPIPGVGDWIADTMDVIAQCWDYEKALDFASELLSKPADNSREFTQRGMLLLENLKSDLDDDHGQL